MTETCAWLGLQEDATRKQREPSVHPGAWAGSVVHVEDDVVYKLVTPQERWDKTKAKIDWIWKEIQDISELKQGSGGKLQDIGVVSGFLNLLGTNLHDIGAVPKRIQITLDSWRPNWDDDGWKITNTLEEKQAGMLGMIRLDRVKPAKRFCVTISLRYTIS